MTFGSMIFQSVFVLWALISLSRSLEVSDFYDFERSIRLENGAGKSEFVKLDTPINFFSDIYDHIYVSNLNISNGFTLLTFSRIRYLKKRN